jgi:type IV secretion system protein VirB9
MNKHQAILQAIVMFGLFSADAAEASRVQPKRSVPSTAQPSPAASSPVPPPADLPSPTTVIQYGERDVVKVRTKVRFTTLIVLPPTERILDFICGDKETWVVNGSDNLAYVKPGKVGAETNLNLITASGNIYSFTLLEVSAGSRTEHDLKVFVELKDDSMRSASTAKPRYVSVDQIDEFRKEVHSAQEETRRVKEATQEAIDTGITKFIDNMRFPYRFEAGRKPFNIRAMYTDDKFLYIQARPEETPALYEIKDRKPNLVNFTYKNGLYVVDRIIRKGYFAIGKEKMAFSSEE